MSRRVLLPLLGRLALAAALALAASPARAVTLPPNFTLEKVTPAPFDVPTAIAFLPDGRLLVAEKGGIVYAVANGVRHPLWVREDEVLNADDRGLTGIAVDPNYAINRYLYLVYSIDPDSNGIELDNHDDTFARLVRYQVSASDSNVVDESSRTILIGTSWADGIPSGGTSHTTDHLAWGADGSLLLSTGDGGHFETADGGGLDPGLFAPGRVDPYFDIGAFRAQDLNSLCGKILRLDPGTGHGLPSNPFFDGDPLSNRSRVWAMGLRNPFRFCVRPGTGHSDPGLAKPGTLYLGDVGWATWEEVDVVNAAGQNFGWPCIEGPTASADYPSLHPAHHGCDDTASFIPGPPRAPLMTFNHLSAAQSLPPVTRSQVLVGGVFYPGGGYPAQYSGAYFFGDYARDWIKVARTDEQDHLISVSDFATNVGRPVCFTSDPVTGDLYFVAIASGEINRIRYTGTVGVPEPDAPGGAALSNAYPNPTAGEASWTLELPRPASVEWAVYDLQGRQVWSRPERDYGPGRWTILWEGEDQRGGRVPPGIYLARVIADGRVLTRRVALLE